MEINKPTYKIHSDGRQEWFLELVPHSTLGPVPFYHREDGPARVFPDGRHFYYLNNNRIKDENDFPLFYSDEGRVFLRLKYGMTEKLKESLLT